MPVSTILRLRFTILGLLHSASFSRRMSLCFTLLLAALSQLSAQTLNSQVALIRQQVQAINHKKDLKPRVFDGSEFLKESTDGGGKLTCYFDRGKLVKIVEWVGLSSCVQITNYYIQNNNLVFVYVQGKDFDYLTASTVTTPKLTMECRFYYNNNKPIMSLLRGATKCGGAPAKSWSGNYLDAYARYKKLLLSK